MFKFFLKRNLPTIIIITAWFILTKLSTPKLNISWITDINIWANAIILELFIFNLMSCITIKIKNQYLQTLISLIIALMFGETIKYNFYCLDFSFINILQILILIFIFTLSGYLSFINGYKKGIKNTTKKQIELNQQVLKMNKEDYKNFINEFKKSINFMKNNKFATELIKKNNLSDLESFLNELKQIRK